MADANGSFRVLIVDDTLENIQVLGTILRDQDYQINVAKDGAQALDSVKRVRPDLILLDVMMPVMDGFEACTKLKQDPETRDIPVIFLTAKVEMEDVLHGFELGAVDYVTKPFNSSELLSRVNTHLQLKAARERLEELAVKLSRYLSPQIYDSIFSGERDVKIETNHKYLTVFFSDIVGFTPKVEAMGHLELSEWLNSYLNEMALIALRHGGTLDKFIGDAVMVFFGDPQSMGEQQDAISCVKMALDMQARLKEIGVEVRMGISSGNSTVGNFGSDDRLEYTIIGKEVNAAARLEKNAEPGRILISEFTYEWVKDAIKCEPRGPLDLKGIERNIMTYWAVGTDGST